MYSNKLEKKLKVSQQILKEKCWLKMLIKKVLMNLVKKFLIIKSINENKSIVLSVISTENLKTLKYHTLDIIIYEKLFLTNAVVITIQYMKKKNLSNCWKFLVPL